ncbi:MAG: hypothetical protein IPG10_10125 [Flavobacteriales bacterium]|jgi:hypothetical protein|nr:hypothetical protein [Flavobacteriales bacterium]MBK6753465.1 hypothetical protein [Flavobacteriales bacterium]MBK7271197.1 hypothetical protein [Flavobacteriales bacterium]MBK7753418.1 hypothetical protein [Flavobacteriales bacterium]MBK9077146.1 hypothetical protein [Flavobacteriales bacterium]
MKKKDESKLSMFYALLQVLARHAAAWTGLVPFKNARDEFEGNVTSLEDATQTQETSLKGVALDKRFKKEKMVKKTMEVARSIFAYAEDQGDVVLQAKVNYSPSALLLARDAVVGQTCQNIHDLGTTLLASLGAYGLVAADLTAQQNAIDAYVATVGSPRAALTVRKGATAEIDALVKDSMKILTNRMDMMMAEFEESHPEFFQEYFDARMIVDSGSEKKKDDEAKAA